MAIFTTPSRSYRNGESSHDTTPWMPTLRTRYSSSSSSSDSLDEHLFTTSYLIDSGIHGLHDSLSKDVYHQIENIRPEKQASEPDHLHQLSKNTPRMEKTPFNPKNSICTDKVQRPATVEKVQRPASVDKVHHHPGSKKKPTSLTEHTFDQIDHLAAVAKHASSSGQSSAMAHIDDIADLAAGLAMNLLDAYVEIERIKKNYEADHTRVKDTVFALRSSRTKLEAERDRIQDLGARMNGIKLHHMTALAKCQLQKAEYEHQVKESQQVEGRYQRAAAEVEATKDKRERELLMMATQMWNLKLMVGEMFGRSERTLRDGMSRAGEEIDSTLQRLENVMNTSIQSRDWGKKFQDVKVESAPLDTNFNSWVLVTKDVQDIAREGMEQYVSEDESSAIDHEEDGPEVMVLRANDLEAADDAYSHEGEYRFWDC